LHSRIQSKGKVAPAHAMQAYEGAEV